MPLLPPLAARPLAAELQARLQRCPLVVEHDLSFA
jgi:hypothetical protein